jgi:hypothetical protein
MIDEQSKDIIIKIKKEVEAMNLGEPYNSVLFSKLLERVVFGKNTADSNPKIKKVIPTITPDKLVQKVSFDANDISFLKEEISSLGKISGKVAALHIANYIIEKKNKESFSPEDLEECYTVLKRAGVTNIPPIENMKQLVIDTYNKAKFFERNPDNTYKISGLGYHKINEKSD